MKARYLRVLREINDSIPKDMLMNLMVKEKQFSTLKKLVELALTKPDSEVSPKQKKRMQAILDSGYLEKEVEVINTPVEKQIDEYLTVAIAEAVKQGRLPKTAPERRMKLLNNKGQQYARRQRERLTKLAMGDNPNVVSDPENSSQDKASDPSRPDDGSVLSPPSVSDDAERARRQDDAQGDAA